MYITKKARLRLRDKKIAPIMCEDGAVVVLPISVGKFYHNDDYLRATFELLRAYNTKNIAILLADTLQRHNYMQLSSGTVSVPTKIVDTSVSNVYCSTLLRKCIQNFIKIGIQGFTWETQNFNQPENKVNDKSYYYLLSKQYGLTWLEHHYDIIANLYNSGTNLLIESWDFRIGMATQFRKNLHALKKHKLLDTDKEFSEAVLDTVMIFLKRNQQKITEKIQITKNACIEYVWEECAISKIWKNFFHEKNYKHIIILYPKDLGPALNAIFEENNFLVLMPRIDSK